MDLIKSENIRTKLKESSVGIAGIGGLGSNAAVSLLRAGIGKIVIVDFDSVDESNLDRQFYFREQVGKNKVEALKENLQLIYPWADIETVNQKLVPGSMDDPFHNVDVIIEALDDAETKTKFIEEIMTKLPDKPLVGATGAAGYGHSDRIKTIHNGNLHMVCDPQAKSSDEDILMAPRVCLMANWQANIVLEILLGEDK